MTLHCIILHYLLLTFCQYLDELKRRDVKIVILTSFEQAASAVICEAYKKVSHVKVNEGGDCSAGDGFREAGLNGKTVVKGTV